MALVFATRRFAGLARWLGRNQDAEWSDSLGNQLTDIINETSWDGDHYIYAFMGDGRPVGAESCEEGKLHLNVNAWALFNGVAESAGRVEQVLRALEKSDTPFGKLLINPPYTAASRHVGRIADIIPGLFENGSIYNHGQSFLIYGLADRRMGDQAWKELKKILPSGTLPDIATGPQHQISNFTAGTAHSQFGRNFYSNFTGSVSWIRRTVERMLGLIPGYDQLTVDPVIPREWTGYKVMRQFRGCRVSATVENPGRVGDGVVRAVLDGEELPVDNGKSAIPVEMLAGRNAAELRITLG
jgi:cellobiose phosphorylase